MQLSLSLSCVIKCNWILIQIYFIYLKKQAYFIFFVFALIRSNWLKPCCGRRVALWQVCLLSAGFNCILVACVILVVLFLSLELLIDTKLLQCKWMFICLFLIF